MDQLDNPFVGAANPTDYNIYQNGYPNGYPNGYQNGYQTTESPAESPYNDFTQRQEIILSWIGRVAGVFSLLGGLYIYFRSWQRREHVYHRLMLGR